LAAWGEERDVARAKASVRQLALRLVAAPDLLTHARPIRTAAASGEVYGAAAAARHALSNDVQSVLDEGWHSCQDSLWAESTSQDIGARAMELSYPLIPAARQIQFGINTNELRDRVEARLVALAATENSLDQPKVLGRTAAATAALLPHCSIENENVVKSLCAVAEASATTHSSWALGYAVLALGEAATQIFRRTGHPDQVRALENQTQAAQGAAETRQRMRTLLHAQACREPTYHDSRCPYRGLTVSECMHWVFTDVQKVEGYQRDKNRPALTTYKKKQGGKDSQSWQLTPAGEVEWNSTLAREYKTKGPPSFQP
jgi:hypothetical protein